MARKARIEFEGAYYHVINRGNYRSWIFETTGARKSFLECLVLTCESKGWRLHGWCLMGNHYHLLIQTPHANLVDGMRWLQSTFANRFNSYRKESGHVFQGRYKAILLDCDAIASVAHYIHLNPVRAGLVTAESLQDYEASSFHQLWYPRKRWSFCDMESSLDGAGGLKDTPAGRRSYREYLAWLSIDEPARKRMGFEQMCKGWAKGSAEFKKAVLGDVEDLEQKQIVESEAREMREPYWEALLAQGLELLGKQVSDLKTDRKGAGWKVALARYLRERALVPNRWLVNSLSMGTTNSLSSQITRHRNQRVPDGGAWGALKNQENVD
jgi:putative transposase